MEGCSKLEALRWQTRGRRVSSEYVAQQWTETVPTSDQFCCWWWASPFLVRRQRTAHGKDSELILMLKVETRHPAGDHLAVSFRHLQLLQSYDGLKSQDVEILEKQPLSKCCYCADCAQNLPGPAPTFGSHCARSHPNRFIFGRVIAKRVKTVFAPQSIYNIGSSSL